MKIILMLIYAMAFVFGGVLSAHAIPTIANGSLTGPLYTTGLPSSWIGNSGTPDTMDENNNVGVIGLTDFTATPSGPSPDGGTWVGFGRSGSYIESFGQIVSGFKIGETYNLSWFQGNFGGSGGWSGANSIEVLIDSSSIGTGALLTTGSDWFSESLLFDATATTHSIDFRLANTDRAYVSIDGISFSDINVVPEPISSTLFIVGGATLGLRRFRKKFKK